MSRWNPEHPATCDCGDCGYREVVARMSAAPDTPADRPAPQAAPVFAVVDETGRAHGAWTGAFAQADADNHRRMLNLSPSYGHLTFSVVPCTVLPDTAPLPPAVVARALAQRATEDTETFRVDYDAPTRTITATVPVPVGTNADTVEAAIATAVAVALGWDQVYREPPVRPDSATPRPAPAGEVGT